MTIRIFKLFVLVFFVNTGMLEAQTAITFAGGEASGGNGKISYAIGQVADPLKASLN